MASIRSQIELYDNFTAPMMDVINSVNMGVNAMDDMQEAMNAPVAANGFQGLENEINQSISQVAELEEQIGEVGNPIDDNINKQNRFNNTVQNGVNHASSLMRTIKSVVAAYASMQTVKGIIDLSDEMTQTTARLNMMNDKLQTTQDLTNMVYIAAQRSRGSFQEMAGVVARFGNNAKSAFSSSAQVVAFSELVQKQMTIAGASTTEASAAMLQLSQALGSGVLRGDELNSIFEQAPNLIQNIADYLDVDIGKIREMASEGQLTADIVRNAIFAASDEINKNFASMPMTWGQAWQSMKNTAIMAFQPVLQRINDLANNDKFQAFVQKAENGMMLVAAVTLKIFDLVSAVGGFIYDNWSIIEPLIYGIVAALIAYVAVLGITTAVTAAKAFAEKVHAASLAMEAGATFAATAAQYGFNAALLACPITWIIVAVIALIAIFYAAVAAVNKFAGTSVSATGIICGVFMSALAFIGNILVALWNIFSDVMTMIWNLVAEVANFVGNAFVDPVGAVVRLFAQMADTVLSIMQALASALDTVFGSNLAGAVQGWRNSLSGKVFDKFGGGEEFVAKFNSEDMHLDRIEYGKAWDFGYNFGAGIGDTFSNFTKSSGISLPNESDYSNMLDNSMGNNLSDIAGNTGDTAGSAGKIADSMDITKEDLKYLRDIAEKEAVNRYTTAEVKIDMSGMKNTVSGAEDIDGFVIMLTDAVDEAASMITEGVHT